MCGAEERGQEEREGRGRGGRSGKEEEREGKSQVCSIHKKKDNELIVALTATTAYTVVVEYFMGVFLVTNHYGIMNSKSSLCAYI